MALWLEWVGCVWALRAACARETTFFWMALCLIGMSIRTDLAGVTSFVRAGFLDKAYYRALLHLFHSPALSLEALPRLWTGLALRLFSPVMVNGFIALVADGIKAPKEGKKMPGVKSLHQESADNSKPTYIMGHSFQAIALIVQGLGGAFAAVPLLSRIHEGLVFSNRDHRTLLDKLARMFLEVAGIIRRPAILVADAYYASRKVILPLLRAGHQLVAKAKINSVAYEPASPDPRHKRGRPRLYGAKVHLRELFDDPARFASAPSPVYGETGVDISFRCVDLLWRPVGRLVRFVLVKHPTRGRIILICTLMDLDPLAVIRLYGLRFKIEVSFKQAVWTVGAYGYHFWMMMMQPIKKKGGDQYMHHRSQEYRRLVRRKMDAYHRYVQLACIAQGLLLHLAFNHHGVVWACFRSWLRTMKTHAVPSERVVAQALRATFPEFLLNGRKDSAVVEFVLAHAAPDRLPGFSQAA